MVTGGGPEVQQYISDTPEITEIVQPSGNSNIVELKNSKDSDAIALEGNLNYYENEPNSSQFVNNTDNIIYGENGKNYKKLLHKFYKFNLKFLIIIIQISNYYFKPGNQNLKQL